MDKPVKPYFITTTLPYANSTPHVGHCLEFVQGDALARYFRRLNADTNFNIGLDEHGLKIYQAALDRGIEPQQFVDEISVKWRHFCETFQISYDNFYRTSDAEHHRRVKRYWLDLVEKKDIYKKQYVGKYCVGCEEFKTDTQLNGSNECDLHPGLLQDVSEENWFFKLSKYRDAILSHVESNENFLTPLNKRQELINLIKDAQDISVSRQRDLLPWGVSVPNDAGQTIYVWFDALLNYLFECGEYHWKNRLTTTVQLCGPDNLKFQGLVWQGILASNGYPCTDKLLVHGTILDKQGVKMSKSLGNVVDPLKQVELYGLDAVRYYILKGLSTYSNGHWSDTDLVELYNADLANNYGNLIARTLHLIDTLNVVIDQSKVTRHFLAEVGIRVESINASWRDFQIDFALEKTRFLIDFGNKYINDQKPWSNGDAAEETLNNLYHLLSVSVALYAPVIPVATRKISQALEEKKKVIIFEKFKIE